MKEDNGRRWGYPSNPMGRFSKERKKKILNVGGGEQRVLSRAGLRRRGCVLTMIPDFKKRPERGDRTLG